jgi:hypothetical protein
LNPRTPAGAGLEPAAVDQAWLPPPHNPYSMSQFLMFSANRLRPIHGLSKQPLTETPPRRKQPPNPSTKHIETGAIKLLTAV